MMIEDLKSAVLYLIRGGDSDNSILENFLNSLLLVA